jgi:cytochrome P450
MASFQDTLLSSQDKAAPGALIFKVIAALVVLYVVSYPIYAIFLHPLRDHPGPKLAAITRIPYWIACFRGEQVRHMTRLHKIYGPVVRFGPYDLSYADGQAWKDICVVPKGKKENGKEAKFHPRSSNGVSNIITQNDPVHHAALRRVFSPAFSEKAMKAQEPLFQKYADLMVLRAREATTTNLTKLFNYAAFDIMADLAFGESLGILENGKHSAWLETVFQTLRVGIHKMSLPTIGQLTHSGPSLISVD